MQPTSWIQLKLLTKKPNHPNTPGFLILGLPPGESEARQTDDQGSPGTLAVELPLPARLLA